MTWISLTKYGSPYLSRGALLKFPAAYPFETSVVMMLCELRFGDRQYGLTTVTGLKAAITPYVAFPNDCLHNEGKDGLALSVDWLKKNWQEWVWPEGDIQLVLVRSRIDAEDL
jgi:hypothetical protein